MTRSELDLICRAIHLLRRVVPDDGEPHAVDAPSRCPVMAFAKRYLVRDPNSEVTSVELWQFFSEAAASAELEPRSKSEFLRCLPNVLEMAFGVRKSHDIQRSAGRVRGFKGVGFR